MRSFFLVAAALMARQSVAQPTNCSWYPATTTLSCISSNLRVVPQVCTTAALGNCIPLATTILDLSLNNIATLPANWNINTLLSLNTLRLNANNLNSASIFATTGTASYLPVSVKTVNLQQGSTFVVDTLPRNFFARGTVLTTLTTNRNTNTACPVDSSMVGSDAAGNAWCASKVCGDGYLFPGEGCDDYNLVDDDGCTAACVIEGGWSENQAGGLLTASTMKSTCADGIIAGTAVAYDSTGGSTIPNHEACDDGNSINGDGCSAACRVESGYYCPGTTNPRMSFPARVTGMSGTTGSSMCRPLCGDGVRVVSERCDDANVASGDGCSSLCKLEGRVNALYGKTWNCTGAVGTVTFCTGFTPSYIPSNAIEDTDLTNSIVGGFVGAFSIVLVAAIAYLLITRHRNGTLAAAGAPAAAKSTELTPVPHVASPADAAA